ncbi:hypothetical protein WKY82_07075 [Gordonia malaquae]|uniref:hypothetical protein n=1 Tax=Gordonia malaquae TaxID=410332 RepID=UPI0030C79879
MTRGTIDSRSDYQLVQDHARGEASAFHELIARHQNKLWAVALRTTGNHDDASDALQEALPSIHMTRCREHDPNTPAVAVVVVGVSRFQFILPAKPVVRTVDLR